MKANQHANHNTISECPGDGMNDVCIDANQFIFKLEISVIKDSEQLNNCFCFQNISRRN